MRAQQQVSFAVPIIPEIQHLLLGTGITAGTFLLSQSAIVDGQPQTLLSGPIQWNDTAADVQQALAALNGSLSISKVRSACIAESQKYNVIHA